MVKSGQIINTRGLRGECRIYPSTDEPELRFKKGVKFKTDKGEELTVRQATPYKNTWYIFFEEIDSIEKAEKLKGQNLWIEESDLPETDENEYYYHELMNCTVFNQHGENLGTVSDILETGAHLNLRVSKEDTSFLLPFVDAFVKDVDRNKKEIVIEEMEGLR